MKRVWNVALEIGVYASQLFVVSVGNLLCRVLREYFVDSLSKLLASFVLALLRAVVVLPLRLYRIRHKEYSFHNELVVRR